MFDSRYVLPDAGIGPQAEERTRNKKTYQIDDVFYHHMQLDITIGRLLGFFLVKRTKDGTYNTKYLSGSMVYFMLIYCFFTYLWQTSLGELTQILKEGKMIGSYIIFVLFFTHPLPVITILEAKKINHFFISWMSFQREFRKITGSKLDFQCRNMKILLATIRTIAFVTFLMLVLTHFSNMSLAFKLSVCYYYWLVTTLSSFWYMNIFFLYQAGEIVQKYATNIARKRIPKLTLTNVEVLWIDLYRLTRMTGETFSFTYGYFILYVFVELIVTTYESLVAFSLPVTLDKVVLIGLTITGMVHMASIPFTSQMAVKKIGEEFFEVLLNIKMKEKTAASTVEIDGLLQTISDNPPNINLAGFVTFDNSLITSLVSAMVTYLIVLVQFKI